MVEIQRINSILLEYYVPIIMTPEDVIEFRKAKSCQMCGVRFRTQHEKVRDHDHLTGKYRAALCNGCNINHAKTKFEVNVFFHGLSNYDSHFLIQEIPILRGK